MSGTYYSGSITSSGTSWTILPDAGKTPDKPPKGLLATRAVQTIDGWFGQVLLDTKIVWQSPAYEESDDAIDAANARVVRAFGALFALLETIDEEPAEPTP